MTTKGNITRLFPGGNTSRGFYSYYHHIIDSYKANRIFILKGGPGVGKSSLMKKIGEYMVDKGFDVELHHCSSDIDSLDGLVVPKLKIAIIDGTAPHIVDPKHPGAVDEIIHLGDFWNEDKLKENRSGIVNTIDENTKMYKRIYKYLEAAKLMRDDIEWMYNEATDLLKVKKANRDLINKVFTKVNRVNRIAKERHLFSSALTNKGRIDFASTIINNENEIYYIEGLYEKIKSELLIKIADKALDYGYDVMFYHEPLEPDRIEMISIPKMDIEITTCGEYSSEKAINFDEYLDKQMLIKFEKELSTSKDIFNTLMENTFTSLEKAKEVHDCIETYYVPNVNFKEVDKKIEELIEKIMLFA
ncbi:MAG: ATPase [Alkaliphilus sp.]|nr:ATPase [bacterium AH-315-G05]MBN4074374.1 ATPase [bacterium AH-315-E09]PHS31572.1 MAG: ATPase [Alkaliphilus sp.]